MRNPIPTLLYAALFALGGFILAPPALAQHPVLNDSDRAVMMQLAGTYGWGPVFGWNDSDPCDWAGVNCIQNSINGISGTCGATKLNAQLPPIIGSLLSLTQLKISQCGVWGSTPDSLASLTDTVLVNGQVGQPYNVFADLNGDGVVNAADVLITRQRTGTKLPQ